MHAALQPLARSHADGFNISDIVGDDCLHPLNGRHGVSYLTELLVHWFDTARAAWLVLRRDAPKTLQRISRPPRSLGRPLHARNEAGAPPARCYRFMGAGGTVGNSGHRQSFAQITRPIDWRNVADDGGALPAYKCPRYTANYTAITQLDQHRALEAYLHRPPSGWCACARAGRPPPSRQPPREPASRPPAPWPTPRAAARRRFFCMHSLSLPPAARKISPGVLALRAGATMHASVDIQIDADVDGDGAAAAGAASRLGGAAGRARRRALAISVEYLTSYEHMGAVSIR